MPAPELVSSVQIVYSLQLFINTSDIAVAPDGMGRSEGGSMASDSGADCEDRQAWLRLKLIPSLGNRSILRLVKHFGSPSAVLRATVRELEAVPGLREKARTALLAKSSVRSLETEWESLKKNGIRLLCLGDKDYPSNLAAISDPPAALFIRGFLEPRDLVSVAVVGSRAASPMGMAFTEQLSIDLARNGVTIVSGLAVGIDSAAHRGALKGKGRTIAVLGCGLDVDYPRANSLLKNQIAASGALVSEFPLGTPPDAGHFPQRNRIISGLSLGVVVVEAAHRSGSLITARLALEQGREVFAVPGMARHYRSVGPHRLLKEGAKLVEGAEDIIEEIRPLIRTSPESSSGKPVDLPAPELTGDEVGIMDVLEGGPMHVDDICRAVGWPVSRVMSVLMALELKSAVKQMPGKYFADIRGGRR
jgi:DNA processing protein